MRMGVTAQDDVDVAAVTAALRCLTPVQHLVAFAFASPKAVSRPLDGPQDEKKKKNRSLFDGRSPSLTDWNDGGWVPQARG